MEKEKLPQQSRKLSTYQFFEILQVEWLVADLRCRIFTNEKDKSYWRRVREGKKVTIESIAEKNRLPTIFTDDSLKRDLEGRIYNEFTYPNFHYKDENHKQTQGHWDLMNYYAKNSEVRFDLYDETQVGIVVDYTPFSLTVRIQTKDKNIIDVHVTKVMRIL